MGETVLVIDDEELNLKMVRRLLEPKGCEVLEAQTAEAGIERAHARKQSLILMDIRLPGMDGLAATRLLKKDPATQVIPVIALAPMPWKRIRLKRKRRDAPTLSANPSSSMSFEPS
jgi:two-component system cell cycle response regulator DivK